MCVHAHCYTSILKTATKKKVKAIMVLPDPPPKRFKVERCSESGNAPDEGAQQKAGKSYTDYVKAHPFIDNSNSISDIFSDGIFRDANGTIVGIFVKNALPEKAAAMAADVLRSAAHKTTLRSTIYGGEAPNSGIAGYFDYRGSPIVYKSRKTAFTAANAPSWPNVFPMVDYVNEIYKKFLPKHWQAQDAVIPDIVRINGSVFSTLTVNSKFRTAHHTDVGDFDGGYSCIACLEGNYKGLALSFDDFRVSFFMQPRDVILFNPHHFHSNTELEALDETQEWSRLTCVFYFRAQLGEEWSYREYERRLRHALESHATPKPVVNEIVVKPLGSHLNKPSPVFPPVVTPFSLMTCVQAFHPHHSVMRRLHRLVVQDVELQKELFGEPFCTPDGIPERTLEEKSPAINAAIPDYVSGGGISSDLFSKKADQCAYILRDDALPKMVSSDLYKIWIHALDRWLDLVRIEWERLSKNDPNRTAFCWNNRSEMNSAFFEVCDVAKEIILGILQTDSVSKLQEQWFWSVFASFLNSATEERLGMPKEAVSIRKLNVKIKDFQFGGTRYFKDMPPEEQQRRLERKRRIEEARRNARRDDADVSAAREWLENDTFDYQTENRRVSYPDLGLPPVGDRISDLFSRFDVEEGETSAELTSREITLVVVLPAPCEGQASKAKLVSAEEESKNSEFKRLLHNPAAQRLLSSPRNFALPHSVRYENVCVSYRYATDGVDVEADIIILLHALSTLDDDVAATTVEVARRHAKCAVLVVETNVLCRNYFTIKPEIRSNYMAAAKLCFGAFRAARWGVASPPARFRSCAEIEKICQTFSARFKFSGSPLNSVMYCMSPL